MSSPVKHEHDPFIKRISCVDLNITWTRFASTRDLFINEFVMSSLQVVSNFATPTWHEHNTFVNYIKFSQF